ncbi:MBL fold metallo-hydrolase [Gudongella sp. DL1XJH-153]|uniref:MBL fold metallo-hydrolase n=1 Tax=Gudongella sp. DL1XJH-153 TaxID=3409804 RepID=UPI003BB59D4F
MIVKRLQAGVYAANCYIIHTEDGKGIVVDPAGDVEDIMSYITAKGIRVDSIILTHGHGDHIGGVMELKNKLKIPVMVHSADEDMVKNADLNLSTSMPIGDVSFKPDILLKDGEIILVGNKEIKIIHTPGHTRGGICILMDNILITGDTLFKGSIGRTDLYGGDFDMLIESIMSKLMVLAEETKIYPGHGEDSTIGFEKKNNPFIRNL